MSGSPSPASTPDDVTGAIAGNFCCCTGYKKIIASILAVSEQKDPAST